ncbi:hypothetical protein A2291_00575 [candidate division WOR-1 bacterium RIFOXYB2_FULL_42_35]|uniref:Phosphodiester glycosidase domain-containing protein n=1 Tax=candidate division WOR-1 bacterium RIFOXYC2_FULL_41_25 TaxID=1802586 RepID=A0A1F4TK99_UNCSA|nr:MAG: hypothetical protein A2247_06850 [candidate division WOR-1 bacterium RIFOXYA2_FULL_41_14]OGC23466.1 MAG: hypothetical protein A2291_00575 [candidate division WOR-1 bacterium RIFOXYB2_FULL_42_35]OGC32989.1 MAG: hypothetical protein A2462_03620 [candidate division WOR-1 bacterium RIFOXYC2_FULL_41_25]
MRLACRPASPRGDQAGKANMLFPIRITLYTLLLSLLLCSTAFASTLEQLRFVPYPDKTRLVFDFDRNFQYETKANKLTGPPRLVIDLNRNFLNISPAEIICGGLEFARIRSGSKSGIVHAQVLTVDPQKIELRPALARKKEDLNLLLSIIQFFNPWKEGPEKGQQFYLNTVSNIVKDNQALAGVNGTFFASNGDPLGILLIDGKVLSQPIHDRTSFFIDDNNRPYIDNIFVVKDKNSTSIKLVPYATAPKEISQLISGGPRLIKKGRLYVSKLTEKFQNDIARGRAARTAIGITKQDQILLVTVDVISKKNNNPYDQRKNSIGVTLEELSQLMLDLGAVEAMNLDGGGSSTMFVKDQVVNNPTGGQQRLVSNAIILKIK